MRWLARAEKPTTLRCRCGAIELGRICTLVKSTMYVDGRVEDVPIGGRYSCQRCGLLFSVGPAGSFDHHEQALPIIPQVARMGAERNSHPEPPHPIFPPRKPLLPPLERPE